MSNLRGLLDSLYLEAFGGHALRRIGVTHPFDLVVSSREEVSARLGGDARALELVDSLMTSRRLSWGRVFGQEEKDELLAKVTEIVLRDVRMNSSMYSTNMHALALRVYAFVGASREKYRVLADWWLEKKCYTDAIRAFQLSVNPEELPSSLIAKGDALLDREEPRLYAAILFYEAAWGEGGIPDEKVLEIGFDALSTHLGWRYLRLILEKNDPSLLAECAEWALAYGASEARQGNEESLEEPDFPDDHPPDGISNEPLALFLYRKVAELKGVSVKKEVRDGISDTLECLSRPCGVSEELRRHLAGQEVVTLGHLVERCSVFEYGDPYESEVKKLFGEAGVLKSGGVPILPVV